MKKFGKRLSFLLAILVLISFALPTALLAEQETTAKQETKIVIHKLVMTQKDLGLFAGFNDYNGTAIDPVKYGDNVKEVSGVAFRLYKEADDKTVGATLGDEIPYEGLTDSTYYLQVTEGSVNGVYLTEADNAGATISNLANGTYVIVEDKVASTYENDGALPADSKAIPATITLPYTLPDGSGYFDNNNPLHLYPKNTEEKPDIEKIFGDELTGVPSLTIGDSVPYIVTTTIDKGATYKTLTWTDTMANGLTYDKNLLVSATGTTLTTDDYEMIQTNQGFILNLTAAGLAKVETVAASGEVTITLNYSATINEDAEVDTKQANTITLEYGNRPTENRLPKEVIVGDNGEIKVSKTWAEGTTPVAVTFDVFDTNGNRVGKIVLDAEASVATLTGLDAGSYYVVEPLIAGISPSYETTGNTAQITNNNNTNPDPITPKPIEVVTYGQKFVKEDKDEATLLAGAQFYISKTNANTVSYLALKDEATRATELNDYTVAEAAYIDAVAKKTGDIANLKAARDKAYEAMNMSWTWVAETTNAYVLISSVDGSFEIKGLAAGTYSLVEIKAPEGYALPTEPNFEFTVGDDSYAVENIIKITNTALTIPQTGGTGTVIFFVSGVAIMALALVGMKLKKSKDAE